MERQSSPTLGWKRAGERVTRETTRCIGLFRTAIRQGLVDGLVSMNKRARHEMTVSPKPRRESGDEERVERLVAALCERLVEVFPKDRFEVTVDNRLAIRILGIGPNHGNIHWLVPMPLWAGQSPVEDKMQLFLDAAARQVQALLSKRGTRWPKAHARPKVLIGDDQILVWWGGPRESDAVIALRPIARSEIGM